MKMTKEIFEQLQPYEGYLRTAMNDFVRLSNRAQLEELDRIYKLHFGVRESPLTSVCTKCVLRALKLLATDYFEIKKVFEQLELKKKESEIEEVTKPTKKKATNKKIKIE